MSRIRLNNKLRKKSRSKFLKHKKGEKELQMIFGLFILLIISLVVLMLFFRFIKSSTGSIKNVQKDFFTKNKIDSAVETCKSLCDEIESSDDAIEFCAKTLAIDFDGDGQAKSYTKWSRGRFIFCEDKIPCFVLYPKCPKPDHVIYDGAYCKNLLKEMGRDDYLDNLMYDDPRGTCDLPIGDEKGASANWILKYKYYRSEEGTSTEGTNTEG